MGGIIMKDSGRMFRSGVKIKDFGERLVRVPILCIFAPAVKNWGIVIRDRALGAAPRRASKLCPFCGDRVVVIEILSYRDGKPWQFKGQCQGCGVVLRRFTTKAEAETLGKAE
jgi:hypothetical protein